jgi:hypothetical protein
MTGIHYGIICGGGRAFANGMHCTCLLIRLNDTRVIRLFVQATNYLFRANEAVTWNDSELYWHPNSDRCVKFDLVHSEVVQ